MTTAQDPDRTAEPGATSVHVLPHDRDLRDATHRPPSDVADAAAFLLGADGSFVSGSDLLIDGGVIAAMRNDESAAR